MGQKGQASPVGEAGPLNETGQAEELEDQLRRDLTDAGFTVEPPERRGSNAADGGLRLQRVPGRGVVVSWDTRPDRAAHDFARYESIRTAVQLALLTILGHAGYQVRAGSDGDDVLDVRAGPGGLACPPEGSL